jgi:membrane-associated protease RseP (regulator of RpoE activity)
MGDSNMQPYVRLFALLAMFLTVTVGGSVFAADLPTPKAPVSMQETKATGGYLGVLLGEVPDAVRAQVGGVLPLGQGVMIRDVVADSPAAKAGLQIFDILLSFADQKLFSAAQLTYLVRADRPNTTVMVRFVRNGVVNDVRVTLGQAITAPELPKPTMQPEIGRFKMPLLRHQLRSLLPSFYGGTLHWDGNWVSNLGGKWDSFSALTLKKLDDGNFKLDIQYLDEDGKRVDQSFTGSRDMIRQQIMLEKKLPSAERDQLLTAINEGRGGGEGFMVPADLFAPLLFMPHWPHWFNWPADL